jgi:hypothetical protein
MHAFANYVGMRWSPQVANAKHAETEHCQNDVKNEKTTILQRPRPELSVV